MTDHDFSTTFTVDQSPETVFAAINNVRGWWSENIKGSTDTLGEEYDYGFRDIHRCKIKVTALVPGKRVAWRVLENYFNFTEDETEWTNTEIFFDISRNGDKTEVRFTHQGLVPDYECYDICRDGWGTYINGSLKSLIATGKGTPNEGEALTGSERALVR
jgi:uncharacterized protein YndB with AHSA1/START domain